MRSARTRVKRLPERGHYDRETIYPILDSTFICHVGFVVDGSPFVIPTGYARVENELVIHGSSASRMLRTLNEGVDVCVTVTILDGLVLARSAFNHSMNYRSVVVLGKAVLVTDKAEKLEYLRALSEQFIPGRWDEVRGPSEIELKATSVLKLPLDEASAKVRSGGPIDDDEDMALNVWAGVVPLKMTASEPMRDEQGANSPDMPSYIANFAL